MFDPIENPFLFSTIIALVVAVLAIVFAIWILISWPAYCLLAVIFAVVAPLLVIFAMNPYP